MQTAIEPLDARLAGMLKSQVTISSLQDAVRELVQNSVDSGATEVELTVEEVTGVYTGASGSTGCLNLKCKDNGCGISPRDMENVARRFYTSKVVYLQTEENSSDVLDDSKNFGFRGEALHSISGVCSYLNITSKVKDHNATFRSSFVNQLPTRPHPIVVSDEEQRIKCSSSATLVSVIDLFGNYPVRKIQLQNINWKSFTSDVRSIVFNTFLFSPHASFKFYRSTNSSSRQLLFSFDNNLPNDSKARGIKSQITLFKSLYGPSLLKTYEIFSANYKGYEIDAVFGLEPVQTRSYQYVFLNNRQLKNCELMKSIDREFNIFETGLHQDTPNRNNSGKITSPSKMIGRPFSMFPIFIIFIKCKLKLSDITQDPSKEIYFTDDMEVITAMILKIVKVLCKSDKFNINRVLESPTKKARIKMTNAKSNDLELKFSPPHRLWNNNRALSAAVLKSKNRFDKLDSRQIENLLAVRSDEVDVGVTKFPSLSNYETFKTLRHNSIYYHFDGASQCCTPHDIKSVAPDETRLTSPFFANLNQIELNRLDLRDITVVNQIQGKFILATIKLESRKSVVIVMDQHACDERIKVEDIYRDFIEKTALDDSRNYNTLEAPLKIFFADEERDLLFRFESSLMKWGIRFTVQEEEGNQVATYITHIPSIISQRVGTDTYLLRNGLREYLDNLSTRNKTIMSISSHTSIDWWDYVPQMPDLFKEIIKSKSCRSAIMFGDKLSIDECQQMATKLSRCRSPFKCAHGRPSVYPLADLSL